MADVPQYDNIAIDYAQELAYATRVKAIEQAVIFIATPGVSFVHVLRGPSEAENFAGCNIGTRALFTLTRDIERYLNTGVTPMELDAEPQDGNPGDGNPDDHHHIEEHA